MVLDVFACYGAGIGSMFYCVGKHTYCTYTTVLIPNIRKKRE